MAESARLDPIPSAPPPPRVAPRLGLHRQATGAVLALAVLVVANALFTPNFATASNLWNVLLQVSTVVIVASGMTLVIATGGIDLSVGAVMAIAGATASVLVDRGLGVALLAAVGAGAVVGAINGTLVARLRVQPIVVTLATLIAGRGVAQIISNEGELVPIADAGLLALGRGHLGPFPTQVVIAVAVVALAVMVMRATTFGRYLLATGGNAAAARLAGVPVSRTLVTAYVTCAALAGLAGLVEVARLGASDGAKIGLNAELDAIAAVVVGGTALSGGRATLIGTVVGALIMQVIATSFNMLLVPYAWSLAFKAAIIVLAVFLQRPRRV